MNYQSQAHNKNLRFITKNGSIHLARVEDQIVSAATTDAIQLELEFNQPSTDYH